MAWIPLDGDLFSHRKTKKLRRLLGPLAEIYVIRMWAWAAKFRQNGKFCDDEEIADAWEVDVAQVAGIKDALVKSSYLESDGLSIYGWMQRDHVGEFLVRLEQRKTAHREAQSKYRSLEGEPMPSPEVAALTEMIVEHRGTTGGGRNWLWKEITLAIKQGVPAESIRERAENESAYGQPFAQDLRDLRKKHLAAGVPPRDETDDKLDEMLRKKFFE